MAQLPSTFYQSDTVDWHGESVVRESARLSGYRGIWFTLGAKFEWGDKYSGGLGTYTANHLPMASYSAAAEKTFFTYGGAPDADTRELAIMVSYYDHRTGEVPRPVTLYFDPSVDDPHDDASLTVDPQGYIWVFKSGRGTRRPGLIFRSAQPHTLDAFELLYVGEFTYPQIHLRPEGGFFLMFTRYTMQEDRGPARKLFWNQSANGREWTEAKMLAGFEGHYQTSGLSGEGKVSTFFNWHPGSNVDQRTNLYYAQTLDWGQTWTTADGALLEAPLLEPRNAALVVDYQAQGKCMYTCDVNFDAEGNPLLLHIASRLGEPGPAGDPREWTILHWKNGAWIRRLITTSDHNYDMGSLYVHGREWRVIGPTGKAPQRWGTGGEMELWVSEDEGETWERRKVLTSDSPYNHSYARRPLDAAAPFQAFWADGHAQELSPSHLFFTDLEGNAVYRLPYEMSGEVAKPELIEKG